MEELEQITNTLKKNTMFHLSLGSKELFHSNFLEFLWNQDKVRFINMLIELSDDKNDRQKLRDIKKTLLAEKKNRKKESGEEDEEKSTFNMAREKEKFDICIYHKEGNNDTDEEDDDKIVYDVIIENKVKSIPYKEQLDRYKNKVLKNQGETKKGVRTLPDEKKPVYILLSLSTKFAQQNMIFDLGWHIISYGDLAKSIMRNYNGRKKSVYINDYIKFIRDLNELEKYISINQNNPKLKGHLKEIRMYDLYCKLSGSMGVQYLYDKLSGIQDLGYELHICGEIKRDRGVKFPTIFLDSAIASTKETILTATIINPNTRENIMYEVQIEEIKYKHMYNKKDYATNLTRNEKIDENHGLIKNLDKFSQDFVTCSDITGYSNISDELKFGKYRPDVVYGYKTMNTFLSEELIDIMCKDIQNFCEKLSNIQ